MATMNTTGSLMQTAMTKAGSNPFQAATKQLAQGSQYQAQTQTFNEDKGVAGRIDSMLSSGSPLMETARTRAAQSMQGRGLLNSSMAVQAGQQAMIDSAAPIAQADAQLYQQQELANQTATNNARSQNAQLRTNVGLEGMKLGESSRQADNNLGENARQFNATNTLDYKKLGESSRQFDVNTGLEKSKLTESARQFNLTDASTNKRFQQELAEKSRQFNVDTASKAALQTQQLEMQKTLAQMDADSKTKVAELENSWRLELSRNEKIAGAWGTAMESIRALQGNKDLDESTKRTLIQQNLDNFAAFASFSQKLANSPVDISDLLQFTTDNGVATAEANGDAALAARIKALEEQRATQPGYPGYYDQGGQH